MDQQGQSGDSDSVVLEMDPWVTELKEKLANLNSSTAQPGVCTGPRIIVGRVRDLTRNVCSSEYDPDYVSIGPYNYSRHLPTQDDKLRTLAALLLAAEPSMTVEVYVNELASLEAEARSYYANRFDGITKDQFVRMLLLDGCYLLSRFARFPPRTTTNNAGTGANGSSTPYEFAKSIEDLAVVRDVFYLAENQLPFFVLEKIGELTASDGDALVRRLIRDHALALIRGQRYLVAPPPPMKLTEPGNLLHLLHMLLKPGDALSPSGATGGAAAAAADQSASVGRWRTATEYSYAGVKFKGREMSEEEGVRCIFDVKLDSGGGTLEVPCLDIDNETWRLLRNLMELEQRNREKVGSHVTAYCVFMSQVASAAKDVELLRKTSVIVHAHGTDGEVAQLFADLCKGIVFNTNDPAINYLWEIRRRLEKRSRSYPRRWMAWLLRKYFTNPWLAVGLLAAAVGLVCAVVQAVYSVLSYKQGRN